MNKKLNIPSNIFEIGKESDIKSDITSDSTDIKDDSNDIIIEIDESVGKANVTIILRLKQDTVNKMDELAYQTRKSRNYIAQRLLDQALANVKIRKK